MKTADKKGVRLSTKGTVVVRTTGKVLFTPATKRLVWPQGRRFAPTSGQKVRIGRGEVRFFRDAKAAGAQELGRSGSVFVPGGKYEPGKFKGLDELRRKYNLAGDE